MSLEQLHSKLTSRIEIFLESVLSEVVCVAKLQDAMKYSTLSGGKRIRPLLTIATGNMFSGAIDNLVCIGSAIELIHCYSLIHDDLPAMDNDDFRRGKLSCHKKFGEAIAILAGDALQSMAFSLLSSDHLKVSERVKLEIIHLLANASGVSGMVGGQVLDISSSADCTLESDLHKLHGLKTGKLIEAGMLAGYLCSENITSNDDYSEIQFVSSRIGLLFQIIDDIIDFTSSTEILGKTSGKDGALQRATYVTLLGVNEARKFAGLLYEEIVIKLNKFKNSSFLLYLINLIYSRNN